MQAVSQRQDLGTESSDTVCQISRIKTSVIRHEAVTFLSNRLFLLNFSLFATFTKLFQLVFFFFQKDTFYPSAKNLG